MYTPEHNRLDWTDLWWSGSENHSGVRTFEGRLERGWLMSLKWNWYLRGRADRPISSPRITLLTYSYSEIGIYLYRNRNGRPDLCWFGGSYSVSAQFSRIHRSILEDKCLARKIQLSQEMPAPFCGFQREFSNAFVFSSHSKAQSPSLAMIEVRTKTPLWQAPSSSTNIPEKCLKEAGLVLLATLDQFDQSFTILVW